MEVCTLHRLFFLHLLFMAVLVYYYCQINNPFPVHNTLTITSNQDNTRSRDLHNTRSRDLHNTRTVFISEDESKEENTQNEIEIIVEEKNHVVAGSYGNRELTESEITTIWGPTRKPTEDRKTGLKNTVTVEEDMSESANRNDAATEGSQTITSQPSSTTENQVHVIAENQVHVIAENQVPLVTDITRPDSMLQDIAAVEEELNKRSRDILSQCRKLKEAGKVTLKKRPTQFRNFPNLKLGWCPIFKAGSSNWKDYLARILHIDIEKCGGISKRGMFETCLHNHLNKYSVSPDPVSRDNLVNFMTVRHPYERVVSAYRDKVQNADKLQFYNKIGSFAKRKYRELPPELEGRRHELADASDHTVRTHGAANPSNPFDTPPGPTFLEFSKARLLDMISDDHWASYEKYCAPCTTNYTVFARFETLERDNQYILSRAGLRAEEWGGKSNPTAEGRTREEIWKEYFKELNTELLERYREVYRVDCQIFGYDCDVTQL